jgi:formate dehydrogenase iron-sulfur subunit
VAAEKAMFLDLSTCIGCRACQVACKEWNELPEIETHQHGTYENPSSLSGDTWKQVKFIQRDTVKGEPVWLFYSDSCKHCADAPCMAACPTGAITRNEHGAILVNENVCNGNRHCVTACPFNVIEISSATSSAAKCTFCHDRLDMGLEPACAKVCPTDCIQYGERDALLSSAHARLQLLQDRGNARANLYGENELGGLGVFYLLTEPPEIYGLPRAPVHPRVRLKLGFQATLCAALAVGLIVVALLG